MNPKSWILLLVLLLAGGIYATFFTDWVSPPSIQIDVSTRPSGRVAADASVLPTLFLLDREYPLQSVSVTALSNVPPSQLNQSVWLLRAVGHPEPVRGFAYGEPIQGLKTIKPPSALLPGALYRIEIKVGRHRGTRDFKAVAPAPLPEPAF